MRPIRLLFVLTSPVRGGVEEVVLALLRRFNQERGQTVVLVTHDSEVGGVCDRIVRMRDGLIVEDDAHTNVAA